jgi:hypothetical protein
MNTPFGGNSLGDIRSAEASLYFPGILPHHSLKLYTAYQFKQPGDYSFADIITYPRGYSGLFNDQVFSFSADYKFPFLYPDLSIGPLLYLLRLKADMFFDYASGKTDQEDHIYNSVGIELTGDMHILRFLAPVELGVRALYRPVDKTFGAEFLFSINFTSLYKGQNQTGNFSPVVSDMNKFK